MGAVPGQTRLFAYRRRGLAGRSRSPGQRGEKLNSLPRAQHEVAMGSVGEIARLSVEEEME